MCIRDRRRVHGDSKIKRKKEISMIGQVVHRFVRNPTYAGTIHNRVANRGSPFQNTLTVLEDPKNGRKLYLIGTTNSSTTLAQRTRRLIQDVKPDSVLVMANEKWWNMIKDVKNVDSQQELNHYNLLLNGAYEFKYPNNARGLIFKLRLYPWLFFLNWFNRFPADFHPFTPGLEMKYAVEEAQKLGANVHFAGLEINPEILNGLALEKRMDLLPFFVRSYRAINNKLWDREAKDTWKLLETVGGEAFAENIDKFRANWFVKLFEKMAPLQKRVLVDQRDVDLFYAIYRDMPGKNLVAVINQWHVAGVEAHWRHTTETEIKEEPINPVGDFDIEKYQEGNLVNDALREIVSRVTSSEPATSNNYITHYVKEVTEAHRARHVFFWDHKDEHMDHSVLSEEAKQRIDKEFGVERKGGQPQKFGLYKQGHGNIPVRPELPKAQNPNHQEREESIQDRTLTTVCYFLRLCKSLITVEEEVAVNDLMIEWQLLHYSFSYGVLR
eukprot:TRINITY_DN787_c0_g1_i2.p1 TRINITY_DN787_c0_g1~~TRINITY_DN787_c0_g1_i2.p1  ORF type:complete len:497 (-),score=170.05 TRINITY_DN787_c0_g1_i2:700-2190(-)